MLSLFKLPFWGKNHDDQDRFSIDEIAPGIFRNYSSRKNNRSEEMDMGARKCLQSELDSLDKLLGEKSKEDQYDLIRATLQRIDQQLEDL